VIKKPTKKDVIEYTAGEDILLYKKLVKYDALGSIAHCLMLKKIGILQKDETEKIVQKLKEIVIKHEEFELDPGLEDVHTCIENYLVKNIGSIGKKIHTGRSRNDQIILDLKLFSKDNLLETATNILSLCESCTQLSEKNLETVMPGYTHMQHAMPSTFSFWLMAFCESFMDDFKYLLAIYDLIDSNPLGAAAGYGVNIPLDRELTTKLLGFKKIQENALYVQNSRGKNESLILSGLSQIMLDLSKLAQDLILFSTEEFGFFELPEDFCTGSSIMPQKKNPDILEIMKAKASTVFSYLSQTLNITKSLPSGYNRDLQETKKPLLHSFEITISSLKIMEGLLKGLKLNKDNMLKAVKKDKSYAADLASILVIKGIPFREAYQKVGSVLKDDNINLGQLGLAKEEIESLTDPVKNIYLKKSIGMPGQVKESITKKKSEIQNEKLRLKTIENQFHESLEKLLHFL
jgi:argininosuccinate lyase